MSKIDLTVSPILACLIMMDNIWQTIFTLTAITFQMILASTLIRDIGLQSIFKGLVYTFHKGFANYIPAGFIKIYR